MAITRWTQLRNTTYPTGLDGGNWLAFGHAILGEHIRSSSLMYPPIVPLAAVASEHLFGPYAGIQVLAFIAGALPSLGIYVLLYAWGLGWRAAVLAGLLATSAGTGEAMAWGGYPQLIGLGILPLFILAMDSFLTSTRLWKAIPAALLLSAALATSDLVGPLTALIGFIYLGGRYRSLRRRRQGNSIRNVSAGMLLCVLLASPWISIYSGLIAGVASNERTMLTAATPLSIAVGAFNAVALDAPNVWLAGLIIAMAAPLVLFRQPHQRLAMLSTSVLVPALVLLLAANQNRLVYLLPLGIVIGLAAWWEILQRSPTWNRTVNAGLITFLVIGILVGTRHFADQRDYYTVLNPGVVQGLAQLDTLSASSDVVAVSAAPHDWALGWWVEGVAHRSSIYAGSPIWLNYADEKRRNGIANRIFASTGGIDGSRQQARAAGAAYLFVDKQWSGYESWVSRSPKADPSVVVYENQSVLIVSTVG